MITKLFHAFLIIVVLLTAVIGCGGECDSVTRFTDRNGLVVFVGCGELQMPLPLATPAHGTIP